MIAPRLRGSVTPSMATMNACFTSSNVSSRRRATAAPSRRHPGVLRCAPLLDPFGRDRRATIPRRARRSPAPVRRDRPCSRDRRRAARRVPARNSSSTARRPSICSPPSSDAPLLTRGATRVLAGVSSIDDAASPRARRGCDRPRLQSLAAARRLARLDERVDLGVGLRLVGVQLDAEDSGEIRDRCERGGRGLAQALVERGRSRRARARRCTRARRECRSRRPSRRGTARSSPAGTAGRLLGARPARQRVETAERLLRVGELLLADLHLLAVVRLQHEEPERARVVAIEDRRRA